MAVYPAFTVASSFSSLVCAAAWINNSSVQVLLKETVVTGIPSFQYIMNASISRVTPIEYGFEIMVDNITLAEAMRMKEDV